MSRNPPFPSFRVAQTGLAAILGAVLAILLSQAALARDNRPGNFDYFVLSLSWSPTYCDGPDGRGDTQQCSPGKRFAFVVHGLWPQYREGWPESCFDFRMLNQHFTLPALTYHITIQSKPAEEKTQKQLNILKK